MICFTVLGLLKIQEYESNKLDLRAKPKLSKPMLIKLINIIVFSEMCQKYNHFAPPIFSYIDNVDLKHRLTL